MRIKVRRRPLWPVLAAVLALLALILLLGRGDDASDAIDVSLSLGMADARASGMTQTVYAPYADTYTCAPALFVPDADPPGEVRPPEAAGLPDASCPRVDTDALLCAPETICVYDHRAERTFEMDFEEYIYCVTASEMPALRELEALKAQAVAARTYALLKLTEGGCGRGGADICTDSGHCQAFHTADELWQLWGDDAVEADARVRRAVEQTRGLILTYDGAPINALFHASSGGHTEDVENVYSEALPYLRGVDSPGEDQYSGYYSTREFTQAEFRARAAELGCELDADAPLVDQVRIEALTDAGQVAVLRIGDGALTGRQVRKAFSLRSQCFDIAFDDAGGVIFDVRGFGHGVGMSQNGADAMAREGCDFEQILLHYYTGVELTRLSAGANT